MSHNFYAAVEGGATKGAQSNRQVTPTFNHTQLKADRNTILFSFATAANRTTALNFTTGSRGRTPFAEESKGRAVMTLPSEMLEHL